MSKSKGPIRPEKSEYGYYRWDRRATDEFFYKCENMNEGLWNNRIRNYETFKSNYCVGFILNRIDTNPNLIKSCKRAIKKYNSELKGI